MVIRKLALSNLLVHRTRTLLTAAAIALSVSLVVAVTSGYATVEAMAYRFASRYMGTADAVLTRRGMASNLFAESIVDDIRKDPDIKRITGRLEVDNPYTDEKGEPHKQHLTGLRRPIDTRVENLEPTKGAWFDTPDGDVVVLDQVAAKLANVTIGDTYTLIGPHETLKLKVVAIVQKPQVLAEHVQSLYLPLETLQKFENPGKPPMVNRAQIDLKQDADQNAFIDRWAPRLAKIDSTLTLRLGRDVRAIVDRNLFAIHLLSYLGGSISMLAATFIIFSALSMGVTERSRTLAMMRAVGAQRFQVAQLVVTEGLLLSAFAVTIGVPLGWLWMYLLELRFSRIMPTGFSISWGGVLFAGGGSMAAALLASLLPAWWATRVRPLEAMAPQATPPSSRVPYVAALAGLFFLAFDPVLVFSSWPQWLQTHFSASNVATRVIAITLHFGGGLPMLMIGFFLLAPLFVVIIERTLGPIVAAMLNVRFALLRQQLSGGVWRAAGTCAGLMVGLAILIAMETQGHSMLKAWDLPDKFPDVFIVSWSGLTDPEVDKLAHTPGIAASNRVVIDVDAKKAAAAAVSAQLIVDALRKQGLPVGTADPSQNPMFLDDSPRSAADLGELTIKPSVHLKDVAALSDRPSPELLPIAVAAPGSPLFGSKSGTLALMAAAASPDSTLFMGIDPAKGLHMLQLKFTQGNAEDAIADLRKGQHIIVTDEFHELQKLNVGDTLPLNTDRGVVPFTIAAIVSSPGMDVINAKFDMGQQFDQRTAGSIFGSMEDAKKYFGADAIRIFAANLVMGVDKDQVLKDVQKQVGNKGMQAGDVRQIKYNMQQTFSEILLLIAFVPLSAMFIAALGVTNTIMASIRTRRWQLGVLRSVGLTRSQLMRLIFGEALLVGFVAAGLGCTAGALMAIDANRLGLTMTGFNVPVLVAWNYVIAGVAIVVAVAVIAAAWPAISVAKTEPLSLLQGGRATA